jgi:hypothetical protein
MHLVIDDQHRNEKMSIVFKWMQLKYGFQCSETEIFAFSVLMAHNSPTFAHLTKVSSPEKISLKPKNIKYG